MGRTSEQLTHWTSNVLVFVLVTVIAGSTISAAENSKKVFFEEEISPYHRRLKFSAQKVTGDRHAHSERPNIVLILTDDQDLLLGSMKYMPKLQSLLVRQGAFFNYSFVSTPMCCPSRSSLLTGLYTHNHNVHTNNDNCSSSQWIQQYEPRTFATFLHSSGYRTGYFGKYLNKYNGTYKPPGWDHWVGLIRNSRFYNYSVNNNGEIVKHGDNYYADYLTDLVANDSVAFFKHSKQQFPTKFSQDKVHVKMEGRLIQSIPVEQDQTQMIWALLVSSNPVPSVDTNWFKFAADTGVSGPVMMVLSVPAPHGPEDAAPQYQHMFVNNTDHRTASWNVAPNPDKQWLLRQIQPMTPQYKMFTDLLQRRRLQTLQSVDDLVEKVYQELNMIGELENTYIIYTSDHGYHLGQFGLIKGKSMSFDFDTRVPLIIRGPGIKHSSIVSNIAVNVDIAPTMLEIGGVPVPDFMDGLSLFRVLKGTKDSSGMDNKGFVKTAAAWRDSILLERGKVSKKMIKDRMREEKLTLMQQSGNQPNLHLYLNPKQQKVARRCSDPENQYPCKPHQKWYCAMDAGRARLYRCRHGDHSEVNSIQNDQPQSCTCSDGRIGQRITLPKEHIRHRRFLRQQAKRKAKARLTRKRRAALHNFDPYEMQVQPLGAIAGGFQLRRCRILSNETVLCDQGIYRDYDEWLSHWEQLEDMIKEYRKALDDLRGIREHLLSQRPPDNSEDEVDVDDGDGDEEDFEADCDCDWRQLQRQRQRQQRRLLRKQQREEERNQRRARLMRRNRKSCSGHSMKCFSHDDDHWKTPPYWTYGPFCFCSNANNNTYWCLRTVNQTHNFLYCEYITNFISFYDLLKDPFQLNNVAKTLNYGVLQQLHDQLAAAKECRGRDCRHKNPRLRHDPAWIPNSEDEDNYEDVDEDDFDEYPPEEDPDFF